MGSVRTLFSFDRVFASRKKVGHISSIPISHFRSCITSAVWFLAVELKVLESYRFMGSFTWILWGA